LIKGQQRSVPKRIAGVALMVLGAALIGYGAHYLAENGTCSSTGYVSYGPVPKCGSGEGLYITSVFFLGPVAALVGWGFAHIWGLLWPTVCVATGVGLITIRMDQHAAAGAKAFGVFAGSCFVALAVLSVGLTIRKLRRTRVALASSPFQVGGPAGPGVAIMADPPPMTAHPMDWPGPAASSGPGQVAAAARGSWIDPLDRIAKLAQLRDSGALTNEEFEREKARLLG
jgi:hypothetical protein